MRNSGDVFYYTLSSWKLHHEAQVNFWGFEHLGVSEAYCLVCILWFHMLFDFQTLRYDEVMYLRMNWNYPCYVYEWFIKCKYLTPCVQVKEYLKQSGQYHACCYAGSCCHQDISSRDIDYDRKTSPLSTLRVHFNYPNPIFVEESFDFFFTCILVFPRKQFIGLSERV